MSVSNSYLDTGGTGPPTRVDQRLERAELRYRALVEGLPLTPFLADYPSGEITYVGPQLEELTGHTPAEIFADPGGARDAIRALIHPDDLSRAQQLYPRAAESDPPPVEFRLSHRDGRWVWVEARVNVVRDDGGTPLFMQGFLLDISDQKWTEGEFSRSERQLRAMVNNLPLITYVMDPVSMRHTYVSPQVEEVFGYTPGQMIEGGRSRWIELIHPDDREANAGMLTAWLNGGMKEPILRGMRYRVRHADGRWVWVTTAAQVIRDENGTPLQIQGYILDITDAAEAQEASLRLAERFETIFEAAPIGITIFRMPERQILLANTAFAAIVGRRPEDVIGLRAPEFVHRDYVETTQLNFEEVFRGERERWSGDNLFVRPDGSTRWVRTTVTRLGTIHNEQGLVMGMVEDITDEKSERLARLESEAQLATLVNTAPIALALLDREGRYIRVNDQLAAINCLPAADHVGRHYRDVIKGPVVEIVERMFRQAIDRGVASSEPVTVHVPPLGRTLHTLLTISPVRTGENEIIGATGAVLDVTERVDLEQRIGQSRQLEALGRLAGGIAHDFNNVLTAVRIAADLVLEKVADPSTRREIETAANAADQGAELIKRLMAFARQQVLQPTAVDLNEIVANTNSILERLIDDSVELVVHKANEPVTLLADPSQIGQVVLNLALNARDALAGGGSIEITTELAEIDEVEGHARNIASGRYAKLCVFDSGIGMNDETRQRAFEPFFTTKEEHGGSGLGLATVYGIVSQSAGTIELESEPGTGTRFTILWPFHDGGERRLESTGTLARKPRSAQPRVLFVENEPAVRLLVSSLLKQRGYEHLAAADGVEAVELLEQGEKFDLLLTDVRMPRLGGGGLAKRMHELLPDAAIIFISGHASDVNVQLTLEYEHTAFLEKPFDADALEQAIAAVLGG